MSMLAAMLLACAPEGSLGKDERPATSDGGSTVDDGASGGSSADGSAGDAADGTGTSTGGASSASSSGGSTDGTTTAADACLPAPDDTACETCLRGHCCDAWSACQASEPCTCIDTCVADGGDATACVDHCGGPNDAWIHLHDCSAEHCVGAC